MLNIYRNKRLLLWGFFITAMTISLSLSLMNDIPERDVAGRYAPMADAFAAGDWHHAFHPRIPPLFPVVSGILALVLHCGGFWATKLASSLFFAAGVFPLYGIFRRVFNLKIAAWGCFLYIICSHVLRLASGGLRAEAKGFTFFLALYGLLCLWKNRPSISGYLWCGIGSGLLMLTRGDCSLYAAVFMVCALAFELKKIPKPYCPWKTLVGGLLLICIITPASIYNYKITGIPVPEVRLGKILQNVLHISNTTAATNTDISPSSINHTSQTLPAKKSVKTNSSHPSPRIIKKILHNQNKKSHYSSVNRPLDFLGDFFKGFYPYFFCIALVVIAWRIKKRLWTTGETILLIALAGHGLLLVLQIFIFEGYLYVSRRYMLPIAPLSFGWTAIGLLWGYMKVKTIFPKYVTRKATAAILALAIAGLYLDAAGPLIKNFTSRKKSLRRQATLTIGKWIKNDYQGIKENRLQIFNTLVYYSMRRPVILGDALPVAGYIAGGTNFSSDDPYLVSGQIFPDYLIFDTDKIDKKIKDAGYFPAKTFKINSAIYSVWKRQKDSLP